jgi:hypothetical protein
VALLSGALATPAFVTGFTALGRRRAAYDALRQPISELARGPQGWMQSLNFVTSGVLFLTGAVGIRDAELQDAPSRRSAVRAVVVVGAGLIGAGLFPTDTHDEVRDRGLSRRGTAHAVCSTPAFLAMPIAARSFAARNTDSAASTAYRLAGRITALSAVLMCLAFPLDNAISRQAGAIQRITVVSGLGTISAFCVQLLTRNASQANAR